MLAELVKRPLVVSVDAHNWNNYLGGIIQYHCGTAVNHAVIVVGYDLTGRFSSSTCTLNLLS